MSELKCSNCEQKAVWLLVDTIPFDLLFEPLCETHFQELCHMEGETNLDFEFIEGHDILETVIRKANEKWQYMNKKYSNLLKLYSDLEKKEKQT